MPKPSGIGGLKAPQKRIIGGTGMASLRRIAPPAPALSPIEDEPPPTPIAQPRLGAPRGGLAGRSLAKPAAAAPQPAMDAPATPSSGLTAMERAEIEELRAANDRLTRQTEEFRHER